LFFSLRKIRFFCFSHMQGTLSCQSYYFRDLKEFLPLRHRTAGRTAGNALRISERGLLTIWCIFHFVCFKSSRRGEKGFLLLSYDDEFYTNALFFLSPFYIEQFVAKGTYEKQADFARLVNKFGEVDAIKIRAREDREKKRAAHTEALEAAVAGEVKIDIGEAIVHDRPVDGVEWWDKPFLKDGKTYADVPLDDKVLEDDKVGALWERVLNTDKITKYVEHPYLDDPPMEAPPPPPPAVKLTKKEQKKLRHQRRVAREQEKQEMIRQGVLEPPKPKVKISNMMRVLTEEAVLDPTMIEKKVKEEMEERQQAHDDRNLSRKLTPAERREKKIRKLLRDNTSEAGEVFTHVYRVENMRNVKNKFKIDVNAQENHLTGIGIITDTFTIVIVEGTNKGLKRYEKLMTRRMDWKLTNEDYTDEEIERAENNKCTLVWKGSGPQRKMKRFHFETLRTEAAARKYLETDFNCANYFDAAQSAVSVDADEDEDKGEENGGGDAMEIS